PRQGRAPNDASEPQRDEGNPTGMLGPASLNGWTMSSVSRWNRLISPQGVFQLPKSAVSRADAAASASSFCAGVALVGSSVSVVAPAGRGARATRRPTSSPQYTASEVGTDAVDQRRSQLRSWAICSASRLLRVSPAGS